MTKIKYILGINRYFVLFKDGGTGWCSLRGMEGLFPDILWDVVRNHPNLWFYI